MNFKNIKTVYFIGIGGISMSGLAMVLKHNGYIVKGSDTSKSDITDKLAKGGITVYIGHQSGNITDDIDMAVYTAAISENNPELTALKEKGIEIIPRSRLLGYIMNEANKSVAVAGTHGKTTTTSMLTQLLINAGFNPTASIGGIIPSVGSNMIIGSEDYFVAEACEYTNSFLELYPTVSIILNIDLDHIDYFKNMEEVRQSFKGFISNVKDEGVVIISSEIDNYAELTNGKNIITFGNDETSDWRACNISETKDYSEFDIVFKNRVIGRTRLGLLGEHNIKNALSACAAAYFLGVTESDIIEGVPCFTGAKRRFELKGIVNGFSIYDDYAHHPKEISATLKAAKSKVVGRKIWCVFQPHTYTRTKAFIDEFAECFCDADSVILADIYAAREKDTGLIHSTILLDKLKANKEASYYISNFDEIVCFLLNNCKKDDLVITMGAGNIYEVGDKLLKQ